VDRFNSLNNLYTEYLTSNINIYVIGIGDNNSLPIDKITSENNLPWVKDNLQNNIWCSWNAKNRDLFIINSDNQIVEVINLSDEFNEVYIKGLINSL
tara:strand:+ start:2339 stop:2629 length:291 start_codon:yes stop_codon:yes gene_type:complete